MKNKKAFTLTIIGLFIFLFGVIGITYAYWQLTLTQTDENLVYTDCLKLNVTWGNSGFQLTGAYPMTNEELVSDFFPNTTPYHFTIENQCDNEVPISINMESLNVEGTSLKDDYVDVILWSSDTTNVFDPEVDTVLSHKGSGVESKYRLVDNAKNESMIAEDAEAAYQLYKFKLGANATKQFNLLLFMDYATPVDGTMVGEEVVHTNNANWAGKITLNNYELPKVKIGGIDVQTVEDGDGLYEVKHDDLTSNGGEGEILLSDLAGWQQTEYRYGGVNYTDHDKYTFIDRWGNHAGPYDSLEECKSYFQSDIDNGNGQCEISILKNSDTGKYVHNYVKFNEELWRIIGLVNVKVTKEDGSEGIEQRLKIIRDDKLGTYSWDHKSSYGSNDWTDSQLMEMLNGGYYNASVEAVECWKGSSGSSSQTTCKFDESEDSEGKGLSATVRGMIDESIIWNIGGASSSNNNDNGLVKHWYGYERGTSTFDNQPYEWKKDSTNTETFHSIALAYPSDYAYATSGGTLGRETCFEEALYNWNGTNDSKYQTECANTDWLKPESGYMWLLSPNSSNPSYVFYISSDGVVGSSYNPSTSGNVWPTLYLSTSVKIVDNGNDGSYDNPYELQLVS